jgi:hypothetical protein
MTQMSLLRGCLDPATVVCGLHTLLQLGNREQLNGWTGFYERANSPLVHIGTQAGLSLVLAFLQHLPSIFLFDPKSMDLFSKFHPIDSRAEEDRNSVNRAPFITVKTTWSEDLQQNDDIELTDRALEHQICVIYATSTSDTSPFHHA